MERARALQCARDRVRIRSVCISSLQCTSHACLYLVPDAGGMLTTAYSAAWRDVGVSEADSGEEEKDSLADMDADAASVPDSAVKAGWFSPARLLLLFCCINMMIYIDRGALCCSTCPAVGIQQLEFRTQEGSPAVCQA